MTKIGYKLTNAHKKKLSLSHIGHLGYWAGKQRDEKTKKKIRLSLLGNEHTQKEKETISFMMNRPETKEKMRRSRLGKHLSEKTKKLMSEQRKGKNHPMYGKHHSVSSIERMSKIKKGKPCSEIRRQKLKLYWNTPERKEVARARALAQLFPTKNTIIEINLYNILKSLNIPYETQTPVCTCKPDALIRNKKIVLFADGEYWHAHPALFNSSQKIRGKYTAQFIWDRDNNQNNELEKNGYKVLRFWGMDLIHNQDDIKNIIQETVNKNNVGE